MMNFTIRDPGLHFRWARTVRSSTLGIVIHHLDAHWTVERTHEFHQSLGWNGIGYNFHIAIDGTISLGVGMEFVGAHTNPPLGTNNTTIGIGCEGRYHSVDRAMPDAQFNALVWLIRHLREVYGDIWIKGHRDLAATACPGQFFPLEEVKTLQFRDKEGLTVTQFEQLKQMIAAIEDRVMPRYTKLEEIPEWGREAVEDAIDRGILRGATRDNLNLSWQEVRAMVFHHRREMSAL